MKTVEVEIKTLVTHLLDVEVPNDASDEDIHAQALQQWGEGDEGTIIYAWTHSLHVRKPTEARP